MRLQREFAKVVPRTLIEESRANQPRWDPEKMKTFFQSLNSGHPEKYKEFMSFFQQIQSEEPGLQQEEVLIEQFAATARKILADVPALMNQALMLVEGQGSVVVKTEGPKKAKKAPALPGRSRARKSRSQENRRQKPQPQEALAHPQYYPKYRYQKMNEEDVAMKLLPTNV